MKLLFIALLLSAAPALAQTPAAPSSAGPAVTVEVSRTHCLVRFVQTLAGNNGTYPGTRRAFEKTRFNTPAAQRWLRRYRSLDYQPAISFEGYPATRLAGSASVMTGYLAASAQATSLPDLLSRTVGLLPNETLLSLDSVYRYFEPAFDTLAWQPQAAELGRLQTAFSQYLTDKKLMAQFGRLRTFYGSAWPDEVPFRVLLNPQLGSGKEFTNSATAIGNLLLLNCQPASRDFLGGTAVAFHEMSHALSAQQRLGLQQQLEKWYLTSASPNRRYAYNLMEEGLATVAGEWIYAQQTGQPEAGEWYHDDYINRYAHALYPLTSGYIERGQVIDQAFVIQAIAVFERTFPQAATDYVNLFRNALYWTNAEDYQLAQRPFRDRFRSTYTMDVTPILGRDKAVVSIKSGEYFPVILVTRDHAATLRYLRRQLPTLRARPLPAAQGFVLTVSGPAGPLVLVNALSAAQLTAAAELLARQKQLNTRQPLTLLK